MHPTTLIILWLFAIGLAANCLMSKAFFLAPFRLGWGMLVANLFYEVLERRLRLGRPVLDGLIWIGVTFLLLPLGGTWAALIWSLMAGLALVAALHVERRWCSDRRATQLAACRGRVPLPVPNLIVSIRGPILARGRDTYDLGCWPVGLAQPFTLMILNPGPVRPQLPMSIEIEPIGDGVRVTKQDMPAEAPEPGRILEAPFTIEAAGQGSAGGSVRVTVRHGDHVWKRTLVMRRVSTSRSDSAPRAAIGRWRYGCRAAFAWRGDHDLYDPSTFQSEAGLRLALGLAARYRMPTTIFLSSRLSLEQADHRAFCEQFGWNRHTEEIPGFIRFLREEVDLANDQEFPTASDRPFSAEIGNHMHLHYGTHAAADPGNGWAFRARAGAGRYAWMSGDPGNSFEEQRDNARACAESIERHLGVRTTSFAIPSDFFDAYTSRAVEAAGIEVGNDTDSTKFERQIVFPAEHHPAGCARLAELTRMSPRDPVNAPQIAMLKFWVGVARRRGRALVYLAHHHLRMYEGTTCFCLTSELLRHVAEDTEGDVLAATVTSLGRYWRDVLSSRSRLIHAGVDADGVWVRNDGQHPQRGLPVDVDFGSGMRLMVLVDVPARGTARVKWGGSA
jgi:hypothetical protein